MTAEPTPKVKSLYKALHLLDYFDQDHPDAGVTELAAYSGLLKSSVHNILQTFELCGYVTQSSETSRYMLGGAAVSLFSRFKATRKIDYRITEYLQSLRDMSESKNRIELHNALTASFLQEQKNVVITALTFYDQEAKDERHIPFSMTLISDYVETLEFI